MRHDQQRRNYVGCKPAVGVPLRSGSGAEASEVFGPLQDEESPALSEASGEGAGRNTHIRRLLVEDPWHHRARYVAGKTMRDRWNLAPVAARARGDEGNRRLHQRWLKFLERRKKPTIANVAIARELAGWCWSLAVLEE
jgi:transposase